MKKAILPLLLFAAIGLQAREFPILETSDTLVDKAFTLALRTVEGNIHNGLITAGGEYGAEWTRDASINAWNAGSLIFPEETYNSLMAVTEGDCGKIGHQYWDKIIWVRGAYNHHLVTGCPLGKIFACSSSTMEELEKSVFDPATGLFFGPSVFNDGIAGYEAPIPDVPTINSSVLHNRNTERIRCLSTNCIYYMAYRDLASMACSNGKFLKAAGYRIKACRLRRAVRKAFYDKTACRLNYLIDHNGKTHEFQESLGYSFAILAGIVTRKEARVLAGNVHISDYGIPSIWPDFERFSPQAPGRHNNIVWPFVNGFWAEAALLSGHADKFEFELRNLAGLAVDKGQGMFYEIYDPYTGLPDGGWQIGRQWPSRKDQTWSATGFLRMVLSGVFGISFSEKGMSIAPAYDVAGDLGITALRNIRYRGCTVNIEILPSTDVSEGIYINGRKAGKIMVPADASGTCDIRVYSSAVTSCGNLNENTGGSGIKGKKYLVIANSMVYYGGFVQYGQTGIPDSGMFYQLLKANGMSGTVIDCTQGGHYLSDYLGTCHTCDGKGKTDVNHLEGLDFGSFDYAILSEAGSNTKTFLSDARALYKKVTDANPKAKKVYINHVYSVYKKHSIILDNLRTLHEEDGVTIVNCGQLAYDLYTGRVKVPGGSLEYSDRYTFCNHTSSDTYHPNPLMGYIMAQMTYCALTGADAGYADYPDLIKGCKYASGDTSYEDYYSKYYTEAAALPFMDVIDNAAEMKGIQQLIPQYINKY